jgi:ATP-dependent DNA ligase
MNAFTPHPALQRRPDPGPDLCMGVGNWTGTVPVAGAIVEPKVDGMRALWIGGELVSRDGCPIHGVEHLLATLRAMERGAGEPMFFDGEFQVGGSWSATIAHFKAAGGRGDAGTLYLFDAMPLRAWRGEAQSEPLEVRRPALDQLATPFVGKGIELLPWAFRTCAGDIEDRARRVIGAGGEGVVVKDARSPYRRNKGAAWQRIRKSLTLDLPVVGHTPLRGNDEAIGALILDHEGVRVHVPVPNGLVVELGAIVEVEAMERTERGSLRQARFVRVREDKATARCH